MNCGKKGCVGGFSLVELVIVITVMGIVAGIATPMYFHALARGRVDAAARRIVADLAMLQAAAEASSSSRTLQFSSANNSYCAVGVADWDHPTVDYTTRLSAAPYVCDLVSVDCGGDEELVFNGFGVPDSTGTIIVGSGNLQRTILIDSATGKGTIQ